MVHEGQEVGAEGALKPPVCNIYEAFGHFTSYVLSRLVFCFGQMCQGNGLQLRE